MAVRGQKPKPTHLRLLSGNAGKRPMNTLEPQYTACATEPPEWLSDAARAHWERLAPMMARAGVLKESDRDLLATYCTVFAQYVEAVKAGERVSMSVVGQLRQLMGELGLTPSARARIVADKAPEDDQEKTRFFRAA